MGANSTSSQPTTFDFEARAELITIRDPLVTDTKRQKQLLLKSVANPEVTGAREDVRLERTAVIETGLAL